MTRGGRALLATVLLAGAAVAYGATPARPPEIRSVEPPEGSTTADRRPTIAVHLGYRACACPSDMAGWGSIGLDGVEVLTRAGFTGTADVPQSGAHLYYTPPAPLAPGAHRVDLRIDYDSRGVSTTYSWAFYAPGGP